MGVLFNRQVPGSLQPRFSAGERGRGFGAVGAAFGLGTALGPLAGGAPRRPSLIALPLLSVLALYVQLFLGAMFRHNGMGWQPHVFNAAIVAIILTWTSVRVLSYYSSLEALRRPAIIMLTLLMVQLCLGFMAFLTKVVWGKDAVQPTSPMVWSTVAHTAVGALLLATSMVLAIQAWRHVAIAHEEPVTSRTPKAVAV